MDTIVVASDLSDRSRAAVQRAIQLAFEQGAALTVVHVVDPAIPAQLSEQLQAGARTLLAEQIAADAGDRALSHTLEVVSGDAIETINEACRKVDADLLVVGVHRRRTFFDQIRETTMEHLVRSSRSPVLLVVSEALGPYEKVLTGVDLSAICAAAVQKIKIVAPAAEVTLFHAHEVSFRAEAERDYATWQAMHPQTASMPAPIYLEASAREALDEMMRNGSYDLLAIGAHTRSNTGRYVLGGFTAGLIRKPPCDLLLAK